MTTQLVITEKTSQARNVRTAVGDRYGEVLAAQGHLIELCEPAEVNPRWKHWSCALLRPDGLYPTKGSTDATRARKLAAIGQALKKAQKVWIATDAGREGQLIGQEILDYFGYRGDVMRVLFNAEDKKTLIAAFEGARPNAEYADLYAAGVARQQADQIYNLSLTRTATVCLRGSEKGVVGVGRVKSPTLAIVCRRELEIRNFKPVPYFEVAARTGTERGEFTMRYAPKERIHDRSAADAVCAAIAGASGALGVTRERKAQRPPKLHNLSSLQKMCGQQLGWGASRTLEVAQELYDGQGKAIITYPRSGEQTLKEGAAGDAAPMLAALGLAEPFAGVAMPSPPVIRTGAKGVFSDKSLEKAEHHAIIPNINTIADVASIWQRLSDDERALFEIVARSYIAAVAPDYEFWQTNVRLDANGYELKASGRQEIAKGWRAVLRGADDEKAKDQQQLPDLADGTPGTVLDASVEGKQTRPPPRYTDGGMPQVMLRAWELVEDPAIRETLKETEGIGTEATRAQVIDGLRFQGFLCVKGKHLVPTDAGLELFERLSRADAEIVDVATTAKLEDRLSAVSRGELTSAEAIDIACAGASRIIAKIIEQSPASAAAAPSEKMLAFARSIAERKGVALPDGIEASKAICSTFLDTHAPPPDSPGAVRAPSPAQLKFAMSVAERSGASIPKATLASSAKLSKWIDANKSASRPKGAKAGQASKAGQGGRPRRA